MKSKKLKLSLYMLFSLGISTSAFALSPSRYLISEENANLFILSVIAFLSALVFISALVLLIISFNLQSILGKNTKEEGSKEDELSLMEYLMNLRPLSKEKELLLHEDYDGIQELDNPVPVWFNVLFYGTIFTGILYWGYYHTFGFGDLQAKEFEIENTIAEKKKEEYLKLMANSIDETNVKEMKDAMDIDKGKTLFMQYCASCHGKAGEGKVGPNLTDNFWLHGGKIGDIFKTIKYGVTEKGMISWQQQLNPLQIQQVSSFILTLKGTNPPNAKEPQGEEMK